MSEFIEVRWHGRGGQGTVTAAKALAEAAMTGGKYIQAFPEYGPERTGAPVRAFNRISDKHIKHYTSVTDPDIVAIVDPTLIGQVDVTGGLKDKGTVVVNSNLSPDEVRKVLRLGKNIKVCTVDATKISFEIFNRNLPNTPILGALIKATNLMKLDTLLDHIKEAFGKKFSLKIVDGNIEAIKRAHDEARVE